MVGADPAGNQRILAAGGFLQRTGDEFLRLRPRQPHAALRRIHRLGDTEAEVPQAVTEAQRGVPVDGGRQPRIIIGKRIGHHMGGGESDAVEIRSTSFFNGDRRA
ncbi:hypothetical protein D3C86_1712540 [compost metagenome]